jgi:hypothetical protein
MALGGSTSKIKSDNPMVSIEDDFARMRNKINALGMGDYTYDPCRGYKAIRCQETKKTPNYSQVNLQTWRALFITSRTILVQWETWTLLSYLTVLSMICFAMAILSPNIGESFPIEVGEQDLQGRLTFLMSFVLSAYVSYHVNRFISCRHSYVGPLWGAIENLNLALAESARGPQNEELKATVPPPPPPCAVLCCIYLIPYI